MPLKSTLAITVSLASIALASPASAEIARSADSFVNSVGVNVHLTYGDTSYGKTDMVLKRLRQLGVRYVRDGLCGSCAWQLGNLHRLAAAGIKSDLIMGNPNGKPDTLSHNVSAIKNSLLGSVVSVEGPNEWDMSGALSWASHLRTYQQQLWQDIKGDPALANMVVVGPSLALGSRPALGNLTPSLDYGNMHSYPGGAPPESNIGAQLRLGTTNSGSKPVMATETGYHNAMSATWGQPPVPQPVTASYIPRTFLSYFARGVVRTFTYELVDEWPGQEAKNPEASFGLLNADFSPKPAFTSLTNLLQTLADPGPRVPSRDVPLTVTARTGDLVHMLFHKRDGSLDLVLWRAA